MKNTSALTLEFIRLRKRVFVLYFSTSLLPSYFPTGGGGGDHTPPEITCPSSKTVFANYQGQAYVHYNLPVALDGNKPDGVT